MLEKTIWSWCIALMASVESVFTSRGKSLNFVAIWSPSYIACNSACNGEMAVSYFWKPIIQLHVWSLNTPPNPEFLAQFLYASSVFSLYNFFWVHAKLCWLIFWFEEVHLWSLEREILELDPSYFLVGVENSCCCSYFCFYKSKNPIIGNGIDQPIQL